MAIPFFVVADATIDEIGRIGNQFRASKKRPAWMPGESMAGCQVIGRVALLSEAARGRKKKP
jgi:hypothetical protein